MVGRRIESGQRRARFLRNEQQFQNIEVDHQRRDRHVVVARIVVPHPAWTLQWRSVPRIVDANPTLYPSELPFADHAVDKFEQLSARQHRVSSADQHKIAVEYALADRAGCDHPGPESMLGVERVKRDGRRVDLEVRGGSHESVAATIVKNFAGLEVNDLEGDCRPASGCVVIQSAIENGGELGLVQCIGGSDKSSPANCH